jgi:Plasmid replication region DNA-binding N-term
MHSEHDPVAPKPESFTGRDILYREGAVGLLDVQRAADALLRQGRKPSVAAIREQLGGGSPNTITPLLAKYWEKLGGRLGDGPESLERVPEALARVTELLWRRALEEARERLKVLQNPETRTSGLEELQEQVMKLSVALAEARAREGEQLTHLATLSKERARLRAEHGSLLALLKSTQALLEQQSARIAVLEKIRNRRHSAPAKAAARSRKTGRKSDRRQSTRLSARKTVGGRERLRTFRKPK